MSATPKRKLCWNCDGSVPLAVDQCTYCGASLKEGAAPQPAKKQSQDLAPPYALRSNVSEGVPQPPFDVIGKGSSTARNDAADDAESDDVASEASSEISNVVSPLLFLLAGSVFALFGLVLWLFSDNGVFTLQWTGDFWYVYLFGGVGLLLLGWRSLERAEG